jgi:hypothetical protein
MPKKAPRGAFFSLRFEGRNLEDGLFRGRKAALVASRFDSSTPGKPHATSREAFRG